MQNRHETGMKKMDGRQSIKKEERKEKNENEKRHGKKMGDSP